MAPEKEFVKIAETLAKDYGVICVENQPVWACTCSAAQFQKLPAIKFTVLANATGATKEIEMPPQAYMKLDQ